MATNKEFCVCGKVRFTWQTDCGKCDVTEFRDVPLLKRIDALKQELQEKDTLILYLQHELIKYYDNKA